jgi:hypothetical protein
MTVMKNQTADNITTGCPLNAQYATAAIILETNVTKRTIHDLIAQENQKTSRVRFERASPNRTENRSQPYTDR